MRRAGVVVAVMLVSSALVRAAWGQPAREITVDELVAEAIQNHPELQAARLEVDAAAARIRQAALRPNPMLELGGQNPRDLEERKVLLRSRVDRGVGQWQRRDSDAARRQSVDVGRPHPVVGLVVAAHGAVRLVVGIDE